MATTWLPVDTASGGTAAAAFFAQLAAKPWSSVAVTQVAMPSAGLMPEASGRRSALPMDRATTPAKPSASPAAHAASPAANGADASSASSARLRGSPPA